MIFLCIIITGESLKILHLETIVSVVIITSCCRKSGKEEKVTERAKVQVEKSSSSRYGVVHHVV